MAINLIVADLSGNEIDTSDAALMKLLGHVVGIGGRMVKGQVMLYVFNHNAPPVNAVLVRMLDEQVDIKHLTVLIKDTGPVIDNKTMGERMTAFIRSVFLKVCDPNMTTESVHLSSGDFVVNIHADLTYMESLLVEGARASMKARSQKSS